MIEKNLLYKEQDNRYLIEEKLRRLVNKDMTFILGAKCLDGVVIVGDTKVTIGEGTSYAYAKKLTNPLPLRSFKTLKKLS